MSYNIIIMGVGGQGTLLASRVLGALALGLDMDVKVSEVHGMSQRGGSVITYVKMDEQSVISPLIEQGEADALLAFEPLEALRALTYLKKNGILITNTQRILPMPVITGNADYPEDIEVRLGEKTNPLMIDALKIARACGNERVVNTVLMGALAKRMVYPKENWLSAFESCVPARFIKENLSAFEEGYRL
jgi:indolepyruvate ferredoxin oxidoreductase beta subunit